jgi:hypothetical protein
MSKEEKRVWIDCLWKPIFSALMTAILIHVFHSGKLESIVLALVLGGASAISLSLELKKQFHKPE